VEVSFAPVKPRFTESHVSEHDVRKKIIVSKNILLFLNIFRYLFFF